MQAAGVIVEYNPFHEGHLHHLIETKKISGFDKIIAVMSGNFVQRGEPALCDKWRRTEMALAHGADIVIELPVYYAVSGAAYFARGALKLLHATGVARCCCFGSECGDLSAMQEAAKVLAHEPALFKNIMREALGEGCSYPAARAKALETLLPNAPLGLFTRPNNGLGIEYCKALLEENSSIMPLTISRMPGLPSASDIRKQIRDGGSYPLLEDAIQKNENACLDAYGEILFYLLRRDMPLNAPDITTDLANRFRSLAGRHRNLSDFLAAVKTKKYTYTRLQRAVIHTVLGITAGDMKRFEAAGGPQYIRILGFKKESENLVGQITRRASLPIITSPAKARGALTGLGRKMLEKEAEAARIYALAHASGKIINEYAAPMLIR